MIPLAKPLVAIVGRPNVGKSMLFNKLTGHRTSIVEDTPGVTRDRIYGDCEWCGRQFSLVDNALRHPPVSLAAQLQRMGVHAPDLPQQPMPSFTMEADLPCRILANATEVLRALGAVLPRDVTLVFSNDPNHHQCESIQL